MSESVQDYFENKMKNQITLPENAEKAKQMGIIYQFFITGTEKSEWVLDMTVPDVYAGIHEKASCKFTLADTDFLDLVNKKVQGPQLFMMGKLKIEGDMSAAMKLGQVLTQT